MQPVGIGLVNFKIKLKGKDDDSPGPETLPPWHKYQLKQKELAWFSESEGSHELKRLSPGLPLPLLPPTVSGACTTHT